MTIETVAHPSSDVAFSPAVKAIQSARGSRDAYAKLEARGGWATAITPDLSAFIAQQRSVFLATASADGQPYIQHRGGRPGFLHVLDEHTIAFADFSGNRQYITTGNLSENRKAQLFLIDYTTQQRVKIWGEAEIVRDAALIEKLRDAGYAARVEQALVFRVTAYDFNCPQHIPQRFEAEDVARALQAREAEIEDLKAGLRNAQAQLASVTGSPRLSAASPDR